MDYQTEKYENSKSNSKSQCNLDTYNIISDNSILDYDQKIENNNQRQKNQSITKSHIFVMNRKGKGKLQTKEISPIKTGSNDLSEIHNNMNFVEPNNSQITQLLTMASELDVQMKVNNNNRDIIDAKSTNISTNINHIQKNTNNRRKSKDNHTVTGIDENNNTNNDVNDNIDVNTDDDENIDQLIKLKYLIDNFLATSGIADTTKKVSQMAPTPTVYAERRKHKHIGFEQSTFTQVYTDITKEHDIQIKITQTFVRNFLKSIISGVKQITNEKWPKCINLDSLIKSITESLPKTMCFDSFYSYVAEYLVAKSSQHYFYDLLASYIAVKRIHNITTPDLLLTAKLLQENLDKNNDQSPILSDEVFDVISRHHIRLQEVIKYNRDFDFDFFGIKTLERSYLYKLQFSKFKIIERPQHMIMRVAIGIHGEDIDSAIETYDLMSQKFFTHATPTLFNAGTKRPQMSSCFLQAVSDSIESIFKAITDIALTSKWSGGIGVHLSSLRSRGSLIRGTNGLASGIIPLCVLLNKLAKYINQGGKRNGSIACYLEPHHADIFDFCELRKNTGNDDNRARDLYLGLWVPSLFMKRVREDGVWSLMCPDECPGLNQVHSEEYEKLYEKYESEGRFVRQVKAQDLWVHILEAQSETGFPYILYKDNANKKSNQKNLGTIRSSNLCAEIIQYSDEDETAVCFTADTEIVTKNGIRKIIDCDGEEILSYFNNDIDLEHHEHFEKASLIHNGKKQVYEMVTEGNKPLKVTLNHPVLVKLDDNTLVWKKVSELSRDDMIYTPIISQIQGFTLSDIKNDASDSPYGKIMSLFSQFGSVNHGTLSGDMHTYATLVLDDINVLYEIQSMLITYGTKSKVYYDKEKHQNTLLISDATCVGFIMRSMNSLLSKKQYIARCVNDECCSKLISIKMLGIEDVYDLSLPKSHNYIANGHVVHNCNLSSICLPMYIETDSNGKKVFNHEKLIKICRVIVRNLDKVIDRNYYPTEKTKRSNMRHRPMGVGVQGLADVYNIMGYSFDSPEAYDLNKRIFETIYYACIDESKELAKRFGPYSTFKGSPASQGKLQFHLWGINEDQLLMGYNWKKLIEEVIKYGLRNSLLTALMPTASTSQIMGNSECMEPYMSNIFKRSTLAGEFIVANKNLMRELLVLGLWDNDMRKRLIIENGSVQSIDIIPDNLKSIYKTAFEINQMHIVRQSSDRGIFIDQSQSLNLFMPEPDFDILTSALFDSHDRGNKTGMYYYRSLPAINPINFGIDIDDIKRLTGRDVNIGGYNNVTRENVVHVQKIEKSLITQDDDPKKKQKNPSHTIKSDTGLFCSWKPGMKLEDCLECGS
jgi:ribonucleotide reductase alpha subunit